MIKHIVIWQLKERSMPLNMNKDAQAIKAALENLNGKIPGLIHIEVGFDFSKAETAGDIILYSEFTDKKSLASYLKHPAHIAVGKIVRPRTCERRMIDYEQI